MLNKKKKLIVLMLLLNVICMSACHAVPQKVQDNMKHYGDNKADEKYELTYCSVEDLRNASMDSIPNKDQNITYPTKVDFSKVKEIDDVAYSLVKDYTKYDEYYMDLFGMKKLDKTVFQGTWDGDTSDYFEDEKDIMWINPSGEMAYIDKKKNEVDHSAEIVKIYLTRNDSTDHMIHLIDGDILLTDLLNQVSESVKSVKCNESFELEPRAVYIRKNTEGKDVVSIEYEISHKGMILDYYGVGFKDDFESTQIETMCSYIEVTVEKISRLSYFSMLGMFEIDKQEPIDQIIDFPSAIRIFENEVASFHDLKVAEIEPIYILRPVYEETGKTYYLKAGRQIETRPVYSFMIQCADDNKSENGILESNEYAYVNVDMITGEVYTNLGDKGYGMGQGDSTDVEEN